MPKEKPKTPKELAEKEVNKRVAKKLADIEIKRRRLNAQLKKLDKVEKKILDGDIVPEDIDIDKISDDEDDDLSSSSTTHVAILLDESGSMIGTNTVKSVNTYLNELSGDKNKYKITITKFGGDRYKIIRKNVSPKKALLDENEYNPTGGTPLYDSIGNTISKIKHKKTLFVILTDGQENASREYTHDSIKSLIKQKEQGQWNFVYLGADMEKDQAVRSAEIMGIRGGNIGTFEKKMMGRSMHNMAIGTQSFGSSIDTHNYKFAEKHMSGKKKKEKKKK